MSNKTLLELTNDVLVRLREAEVQTVSQNSYSKLITKFINDGKRQVEDAWDWNILLTTATVTTVQGTTNYTVPSSGIRFKVKRVINQERDWFLEELSSNKMSDYQRNGPSDQQPPQYYAFKGVDNSYNTKVDLFPVPDGVYNIDFDIIKPQDELVNNSDVLLVPNEPVIFYAYARALAERGEDGGLGSGEAYQLFQQSLADHVAIEQSRYGTDTLWTD
jgi:hypothetical protein